MSTLCLQFMAEKSLVLQGDYAWPSQRRRHEHRIFERTPWRRCRNLESALAVGVTQFGSGARGDAEGGRASTGTITPPGTGTQLSEEFTVAVGAPE